MGPAWSCRPHIDGTLAVLARGNHREAYEALARRSEARPRHNQDVPLGEAGGIQLARLPFGNVDPQVEGALAGSAQADLLEMSREHGPLLREDLAALLDVGVVAPGDGSRLLDDALRSDAEVGAGLAQFGDEIGLSRHEAAAIAGHAGALGETVDDENVLPRDRVGGVRRLLGVEVHVRFVADGEEPVLASESEKLLVMGDRSGRAGRIVRVVVEEQRRPLPVVRGDGVEIGQEGALLHEGHPARFAAGEEDGALVDRIGGIGEETDRPLARDGGERKVKERFLRALTRHDFAVRVDGEAEAPLQIARGGLAQDGQARDARILRDLRNRGLERLADERRRRFARIADAEVEDGLAAALGGFALGAGLFLQIRGKLREQRAQLRLHRSTTGLRKTPTPSTSISTVSPARMGPTPSGVPVVTTSPGSRVMPSEMKASSLGTGKI